MRPCVFHSRGVTFTISYGYPSLCHLYYAVEAKRGEERALGGVRYARLDRAAAQVECLEFFDEDTQWLREAFCQPAAPDGWEETSQSAAPSSPTLAVVLEDTLMEQLGSWLAADYLARFHEIVATIEAGGNEPGPEYRLLWYYELAREAEINPWEEPTPAELVEAFRLVEAHASVEVRKNAAQTRRHARLLRMAREMERWNTWASEHLAGLSRTTVFQAELMRQGGDPVTFATSWYDVPTTYEAVLINEDGSLGYLELFGDTILAYVPPDRAERWYAERWQTERDAKSALYVLNCMLRSGGRGVAGDDYVSWVFAHEGEDALAGLAREGAPIEVSWQAAHCYALASKFYRIPLSITCGGDEHSVGYGVPGIHSGRMPDAEPLQGELWEQTLRLHGWVPLGHEEQAVWPRQADITAHQLEVRRMSSGLPILFG